MLQHRKSLAIIVSSVSLGLLAGMLWSKKNTTTIVHDSGKLTESYKAEVAGVIRDHARDIQSCYLEFLKNKKDVPEGKFSFIVHIEDSGEVTKFDVTKNELDESMKDCLKTKIMSYRFTPPPAGINKYISHSLSFKSEESALKEKEARKLPKVLPTSSL